MQMNSTIFVIKSKISNTLKMDISKRINMNQKTLKNFDKILLKLLPKFASVPIYQMKHQVLDNSFLKCINFSTVLKIELNI